MTTPNVIEMLENHLTTPICECGATAATYDFKCIQAGGKRPHCEGYELLLGASQNIGTALLENN